MASTLDIPEDAITVNKCYLCANILSVPPIMSVSLETGKYKCGRCKNVKRTTYTRNTQYENIAKYIQFPCTYAGCLKKIRWDLVEKHESKCPFRTIECPVYYVCKASTKLQATNLKDHFNEKHKLCLKDYTEGWILNINVCHIFLTVVDGLQFFVYMIHINGSFLMTVLAIDSKTKYKKYSVKLSAVGSDDFSIGYENQKIIRFDGRKHCYRCIFGFCYIKYHPYSRQNKTSEMDVETFMFTFKKELRSKILSQNGNICCTIQFTSEESTREKTYEPDTTYTSLQDEQLKSDLRKSIECPICEEYMVAPIFNCETGHKICNVCKPRLPKCPTCQANIGNSRNFALEQLVDTIELPCRYANNGCGFIGTSNKVYKHELNCLSKNP